MQTVYQIGVGDFFRKPVWHCVVRGAGIFLAYIAVQWWVAGIEGPRTAPHNAI